MAVFQRPNTIGNGMQTASPPNSRPGSRPRLEHDRRPSDNKSSRRYERELRRAQNGEREREREQKLPCLPMGWQQFTPPSTPKTSSPSLILVDDSSQSRSLPMVHTPRGNAIIAAHHGYEPPTRYENSHDHAFICSSDSEAARSVQMCTRSLNDQSKYVRYFRTLIESPDVLDDAALDSILIGADAVFFKGALSGRVMWEWSSPEQSQYASDLVGSTALRRARAPLHSGFETLIILSRPILGREASGFDRRLLLAAFLHELVHCYLFIRCGFTAREKGGHTDGFHAIAAIIDKWVAACGVQLQLCNIKANLDDFRVDKERGRGARPHRHDGCAHSPSYKSHIPDYEYELEPDDFRVGQERGRGGMPHRHNGCAQSPSYSSHVPDYEYNSEYVPEPDNRFEHIAWRQQPPLHQQQYAQSLYLPDDFRR
ncbi:hypothetical protein PVAG01_05218 [Phlyctema vagabunda]|uniref:SprT-like domain-containing protein n=1 Tax=Phlyctema vagabunda TaxID=108571 RepID=A0ABR4PKL0_9HELO